jgi:anti-sigma B factor antagonist
MTYIGIKVRVVEQVAILDADSRGRICLRFGASTVTLLKAVLSLLAEGRNQILLNLASVNYMDAHSLAELISTSRAVKHRGGQLKVFQLTRRLAEVMTNGRILRLFDVYESESQAVASFRTRATASRHVNSSPTLRTVLKRDLNET